MIMVLLLPKESVKIPVGISRIFLVTSRNAYNVPISRKVNPFSRKNKSRNASKKRRFLRKP